MSNMTVMQALGVDLCTPRNEREDAHAKACEELGVLFQHFISGIVTVHEYTEAVAKIGSALPPLQVGDIEPITGLSLK